MNFPSSVFLWVLLFFILSNTLYAAALTAVGRLLGVHIEHISLFFGPTLFRFRILRIPVDINLVPLGCGVKFSGKKSADSFEEDFDAALLTIDDLSLPSRVALTLSGVLALLLLAVILIGPHAATRSFIAFFPAFIRGALDHQHIAIPKLQTFFALLAQHQIRVSAALFVIGLAALNSLPSPVVVGGAALEQILLKLVSLNPKSWLYRRIGVVLVIAMIVAMLSWTIALGITLFSHAPYPK